MKKITKTALSFALASSLIVSSVCANVFAANSGNVFSNAVMPASAPHRAANPAYTVYVAPNGDDVSGAGSQSAPFASVERARDYVRTLPKTNGDIVVQIADGFYYAGHTINFDDRDSGNQNCTIYYQAAPGAKPVISGGSAIAANWAAADDVTWLTGGLKAYKTPLTRSDKLRAIYVNGVRAQMTEKTGITPTNAVGQWTVNAGDYPWAWISLAASSNIRTGVTLPASAGIPATTRNPQNIEMYRSGTWVTSTVCLSTVSAGSGGAVNVTYQMPYAAMAQICGGTWGCAYVPTNSQTIDNVFEWLSAKGQFYFDQAGSMLYYIPRDGEDLSSAQVVVPELETIINVQGGTLLETSRTPAQYITFSGLTLAYSDWNLCKVGGSSGYSGVQNCVEFNILGDGNWHNDLYRAYDVTPAAFLVNDARHVNFIDGAVRNTGSCGIHYENDVSEFEVTGNYIGEIGATGLVIGHPQHVYENDASMGPTYYQYSANNAGPDKEKFPNGTERVPRNILITDNYLPNNCYFFAGDTPIVTFFTQNMYILHNFVYNCPYGGMSIGWGWCNFDGTSGSQLPGKPTTTSRGNFVNFNRVEEIARVLQDTGCVYSLSQQGNGTAGTTDYSGFSEMNNNFLVGTRGTTGTKMVSGFHPDEGSAFINFSNNVMQHLARGTYEFNNFNRKHDMHVFNNFADRTAAYTGAPDTSIEQYTSTTATWPPAGHDIVLNSGLEDSYVGLVGKDVMPDSYYELASNVALRPGATLNRRGLLPQSYEVWIAPKGTTAFAQGTTMTEAAGNAKTIKIPATAGDYTLFIRSGGVTVETSPYTITASGAFADVANVTDGATYWVSKLKPLTLSLDDTAYSFTLNGGAVGSGAAIGTEGQWVLTATDKSTGLPTFTFNFTTAISDANKLLPDNITVKPGQQITLSSPNAAAGKQLWIAGSGDSSFSDAQKTWPNRSYADGGSVYINAPMTPGTYVLAVADNYVSDGRPSDAVITVTDGTIPTDGLYLWLDASRNVTANASSQVTGWVDRVSGLNFTPSSASSKPTLGTDGNMGYKYVYFDGTSGNAAALSNGNFDATKFNGNPAMSVVTVTLPESDPNDGYGDRGATVWANEVGSGWPGFYVGPGATMVVTRFGGQTPGQNFTSVGSSWKRSISGLTTTAVINDSGSHLLYVDGVKTGNTDTGKVTPMGGIGTQISVGSTNGGTPYFKGRVAEVLIYNRALSQSDVSDIQNYVKQKYFTPNPSGLLNSLSVSQGSLSPPFDPAVKNYVVTVENNVTSLTVSATADTGSTISGTGTFSLPVGAAVLPVTVDTYGVDQVYNITVARKSSLFPQDGLDLWLAADMGVTTDANNVVTGWVNQAANPQTAGKTLTPSAASFMPVLKQQARYKTVYFDGSDPATNALQALRNSDFKSYNDSTGMTIITMSLPISNPNVNGDQSAALWFTETGNWGGLFFTPGANSVAARFGGGATAPGDASGIMSSYNRPAAPVSALTADAAVYSGTTHTLYENGVMRAQKTNMLSPLARLSSILNIGGTSATSNPALFQGDIAEVLVYGRALSQDEINQVQSYLNSKYAAPVVKEATPNIAIDYANALLTGFAAGSAYTVNGAAVTPNANGALNAAPYMGQTISVVTVSRGAGYADSDPQSLAVPAQPAAPAGLKAAVDGTLTAAISGVTSAMEYSANNGATWTPCAGSTIPGLAPGAYQVRYAATASAFAGSPATVAVNIATVTFDSAGGGAYPKQYVLYGSTVTPPADPARTGYTFAGWNNGGAPYVWSAPVTSDLTLTAQWTINTYTVTFDSAGGSAVPQQAVNYNGTAAAPTPPTRTGYTFAGWNLGGAAYVFSTPVTGNITLVAQWTPAGQVVKPTSITMSAAQTSLNMKVGTKLSLQITVTPANADRSVTWSSSNPAVATVDPVTGQVTAIKTGSVRITVKSNADPTVSYMFLVMINA